MATTTTYIDTTFSANAIGARTDPDGAAVTDLSAEEARFVSALYTEGAMSEDAFLVSAQAVPNMSVAVGSGVAKADFYCVPGQVVGQGNYLVRLDVTSQNVTIPAADAAQDRIDQIYLVVLDNAYDVTSKSLPRIAHRKGEVGSGVPGPDSVWKAASLLATISVPANAASIAATAIADERSISSGSGGGGGDDSIGTAAGLRILTQEGTSSKSFTDLPTPGPSVQVEVGSSGTVLIIVSSGMQASYFFDFSGEFFYIPDVGIALTGANVLSANSLGALLSVWADVGGTMSGAGVDVGPQVTRQHLFTGLTPGLTTFTMKYRLDPGSDNGDSVFFWDRELTVVAL